ncbi:uncharacterized protein LOC114464216 [Gouania willdenowi]|uniref:uncharacterized protein LOC114464216 n=1 Tax=Gouania willdenowi TaxID=441366 RepID=UPI00105461DF|nr:uncharacterized protein LOC114464216 [Gouania willdenowi]XP_028304075.1 uncharacterized protein LOC114464216 [Gouania willdenowi]
MDITYPGEENRGQTALSRLVLLLFLAACRPVMCLNEEQKDLGNTNDGPANVSISGPDLMSSGGSYTYICDAHCRPSCLYMWKTDDDPWFRGQGNVISVTPRNENTKNLSCKATNTVSGLFVTMTRSIGLITGPSKVQIKGPDVVEIGQEYQFVCTTGCHPPCRYVSSVGSNAVRGNVIDMTVDQPLKSITIKCEAQNTASGLTVTVFKTVRVAGVHRSRATFLEVTQVGLLVAFINSGFFTL